MKQKKMRILIVDDEREIREALGELLADEFEPLYATSGLEAVFKAKQERPHVILLDILMPGMDGVTACGQLRSDPATRGIPIIMLTAANELTRRVHAFEAGADDFIAKPFEVPELLARLQSKLRRLHEWKSGGLTKVRCGNLVVDPERFEIRIAGRRVETTALEFRLLKLLAEKKEQLVSRQEIIDTLWEGPGISARVIDAHIVAVRKKIAGAQAVIKTIYGEGYMMQARA